MNYTKKLEMNTIPDMFSYINLCTCIKCSMVQFHNSANVISLKLLNTIVNFKMNTNAINY